MKKIFLYPLVAALAVFAGAATAQTTLRIGLAEDPDVLDPTLARTFVGRIVFNSLCDKLFDLDEKLNIVPQLATSYTWSADHKALTIKLRQGVTFHDGEKLDAAAVKFNLERHKTMQGSNRRGELAPVTSVDVVDAQTVRLNLAAPFAPLLAVLTDRAGMMVSPKAAQAEGAHFGTHPVCSGPFKFVERVAGQRWVFARNDAFPAALGGPPRVGQLVIAVVDEPATKFAGLASGDLDFAGIAPSMAALAERDPTMRVLDYPVLQESGLLFNTHRAPFDDVRVRRAFDLSIDRERIVTAALAGYARAASGPVAPESPFALALESTRNPRAADSLLDAAGWRRTPDGTRARDGRPMAIELLTVGSGDQAVEQLVQADLAERGVRMEIRVVEFGAFLARVRAVPKTFDLLLTGIPGDLSLAYLSAMYDGRQRGSALDYADYHTPRLDSLFARTRTATTRATTVGAWHDVQAELARDQPAAWLYHSRGLQGIARRMQGVRMDLRGELASLSRWSVAAAPGSR